VITRDGSGWEVRSDAKWWRPKSKWCLRCKCIQVNALRQTIRQEERERVTIKGSNEPVTNLCIATHRRVASFRTRWRRQRSGDCCPGRRFVNQMKYNLRHHTDSALSNRTAFSVVVVVFKTPRRHLQFVAILSRRLRVSCWSRTVHYWLIYTVGHKKGATFIFTITLANVDRFQ